MWAILNLLYREYCLARLQEMRKLELKHQGRKGRGSKRAADDAHSNDRKWSAILPRVVTQMSARFEHFLAISS
jgi:hypothetical protein